jgi:DNA-directed RNA polymerase subunit E'/Rpb7
MEATNKTTVTRKRRDIKIENIYSRCLISKKIVLPFTSIGKNIYETIENTIKNTIEGKCIVEGYVKRNSTKIISFSSGLVNAGINVSFEVVFECDICFPVEGMLIRCVAKNVNKAGIKADSADESPSPIIVFIARDHSYNNQLFADIKEGDTFRAKVIGQRFELNDQNISIIAEIVKTPTINNNATTIKNQKIVIED